jgi:3-oxoacyl-[acyl-carrier-protein] synthase II
MAGAVRHIVVTGLGLITPLGCSPGEILRRMAAGDVAAAAPTTFDASPFACPLCAEIPGFRAEEYLGESKTLRLMNRDAQLAAAAARLAVRDAGLRVGADYPVEEVGLFGATGLACMPAGEIAQLVRHAAADDGRLDLGRFGAVALKRVRPVISFKILSNMPVCFVSIFEGLRGVNAVYTPWEGQGAQAIASGVRAIRRGEARCCLVGGCDTKCNEFAMLALQQQGVFHPWLEGGRGPVPGEGAAFLVLEEQDAARARGARVYARVAEFGIVSVGAGNEGDGVDGIQELRQRLGGDSVDFVVAGGDANTPPLPECAKKQAGCEAQRRSEGDAGRGGIRALIRPKRHLGDLFAAAAAVQVALGAARVDGGGGRGLAECCGYGSEKAAFVLESA